MTWKTDTQFLKQNLKQFEPLALSSEELASGVVPRRRLRHLVKMAKREEDQRSFRRGQLSESGLLFWAKGQWVTRPVFDHRIENCLKERRKRFPRSMQERVAKTKESHRVLIEKGYKAGDLCQENGLIVSSITKDRKRIRFVTKEKFERDKIRKAENQKRYTASGWTMIKSRKRNSDPVEKMRNLCRKRIYNFIINTGWIKTGKTKTMIGGDWETLKNHLESQFKEGMTWKNMGAKGWHLDHIIPLASAKTQEEVEKLCHYTNIQPLWWHENLSKGDKVLISHVKSPTGSEPLRKNTQPNERHRP